ncbi:hypothetical protein Btru_037666 [Bulinus truncatus]|nr:hypothetical protein Btru_037666 [Bulinus truncatus]
MFQDMEKQTHRHGYFCFQDLKNQTHRYGYFCFQDLKNQTQRHGYSCFQDLEIKHIVMVTPVFRTYNNEFSAQWCTNGRRTRCGSDVTVSCDVPTHQTITRHCPQPGGVLPERNLFAHEPFLSATSYSTMLITATILIYWLMAGYQYFMGKEEEVEQSARSEKSESSHKPQPPQAASQAISDPCCRPALQLRDICNSCSKISQGSTKKVQNPSRMQSCHFRNTASRAK